ncbi:MAG: MBOAT family protein [Proteobacteria bacterium]|nr:MAG: MBOAT family protein [Pseudomonadota bacterium]
MSYDTLYFAVFLAAVWLAFDLLPGRGWTLLAGSIVFYSVAGLRDGLLATAIIIINFLFQFPIVRDRRWLYLALTINIGCLAYFKYRVFLATSAGLDLFTGKIIIPLGISFYIFQLTAFLIDLARARAQPFSSLARFALFKLFFGQLVAGPIMRWRQFGPQVNALFEEKSAGRRRPIGLGLGLCLLGLGKKIVLADSIAPFVDTIFRQGPADPAAAWLGSWLFSFQIYFDFSGYSDIALGLGFIFGLRLARNFDTPFCATNIQQLWQRWHITLTQYFRDYVFLPLVDLRMGRRRRWQPFVAIVVTMGLCGLWHGAGWNFVLWGLLHGCALATATAWPRALAPPVWLGWALTLLFFVITVPFFRADDLTIALRYVGTMLGAGASGVATVPSDGLGGAVVAIACGLLLALHRLEAALLTKRSLWLLMRRDGMFLRALLAGACVWLLLLPKAQDTPFIYFRF